MRAVCRLCLCRRCLSAGSPGLQGTMDAGARPGGSPAGLSREYKLVMLGAGGVGKSGR